MSWFFTSSGQSIGALLLSSVLPMNIQGWFPCCPTDAQESSPAPRSESINFSRPSLLYDPTLTSIHDYWKTIALTIWTFVGKVMSLLFNMLSELVITFLPRSKCLSISWLLSPSTVILESPSPNCYKIIIDINSKMLMCISIFFTLLWLFCLCSLPYF